tara:strand:+ start:400 stop:672 length:273 start_codon:yes stop_codon:yes gene_type:complete
MQTYAIINSGVVVNIIEYDAQPTTPPPGFDDGYIAVQADRVSPGWLYENGAFVDTTPPSEPMVMPKMPTLAEQILASPNDLAALKQALGL